MLRNVRPTSAFLTRFISLLLCYGLVLSQLSFAAPLAAARSRESVKGNASAPKLGASWLNALVGYVSNTNVTTSLLPQQQSSSTIVISQVYGGGGNSGSTFKNDFIELFNRSNAIVDLTNWSVQYAPASSSTWQVTTLSGSLGPGQYLLIQETQGTGGTTNLPTPDVAGNISMNATAGKVALVNNSTPLTYNYPHGNPSIADFVGYGNSTSSFEGSGPTPSPSSTNAALRANNGCTDTDYNSTDFDAGSPNPRNSSSPVSVCGGGLPPSSTVVISEFRTRGVSGGYDEFVELYNMTGSPVDISGWKIDASNGDGGVATRIVVNPGTTLPAHGHFLATNNIASGGYSGTVTGDQTYTAGIPDDGGIAVLKPDNTIVDRVGMSSGSAFKESRALGQLTANANQSYERKPGGASGSSQDTNDNPSDFQVRTPSDPQNLYSPPSSPNNQPPIANAGGHYTATVGNVVQFNGSASSDPDGSVTNYEWNFGDGATGTGALPTHAYASPGIYTATLTVTDNSGTVNSNAASVTITSIPNQPPVANAGGPYTATVGAEIQLNGSASSDPDGTIVSYNWNFGDNTSGSAATPSHTYSSAGTYNLTLTVTDNGGATASNRVSVVVQTQETNPTGEPAPPTTNYSLSLNGSTSYVEVPTSPSLNITTPFTVEAWIKTNSVSAQQGIVERYNWLDTDDGGFALRLAPGGKILFGTIRNSNAYDFLISNSTVPVGEWHHIAGVFDGSELRVYIDGVLDAAKGSTVYPSAGTKSLKIGARGDGATNTFNGLIDEVRLSAGVRYGANFAAEKRLTAGGLNVNAQGLWNFDNQSLNDSSGNNNHGTLIGDGSFTTEINDFQEKSNNLTSDAITQAKIDFDTLPRAMDISNYFTQVKFSSPGNNVYTYAYQATEVPTSPPHAITRGNIYTQAHNHSADLEINFPLPANDLEFYINACNDYNVIAYMDVYQTDGVLHQVPIFGNGPSHTPIRVNFPELGYRNIKKVKVRNITDQYGLVFDDFKFTVTPLPTAPTNLNAEAIGSSISLRWVGSADAKSYKVKRATTSGGPYTPIATVVNATSFSDNSGLTKDKTYYYVVSAVNDTGESGNSNQASAYLPFLPPTNLAARDGDDQKIDLSWTGTPEATSYRIKRSTTNGGPYTTIRTGEVATNFTDRSVINGTTYYYVVSAISSGGVESINSNQVSARPSSPCGDEAKPSPTPIDINAFGWRAKAVMTDNDGLALQDVSLNGRYMAKVISNPYFVLTTKKDGVITTKRAELRVNDNAPVMRSRFVGLFSAMSPYTGGYVLIADFLIDRITPTSKSCLYIHQQYLFTDKSSEGCEPSSTVPCNFFYPRVSYEFEGRDGETLESLNIVQRNQYSVNGQADNTIAIFKDCDSGFPLCYLGGGGIVFERKKNPLRTEWSDTVIYHGLNLNVWDNIHQTNENRVSEPLDNPFDALSPKGGCPECVHMHWRWGLAVPHSDRWNNGHPYIESPAQDLTFAIVRHKAEEESNEPLDFKTLVNGELIRIPQPPPRPNPPYETLQPTVIWYSATSYLPQDTLLSFPRFFNPSAPNVQHLLHRFPTNSSSSGENIASPEDGPTSIVYGHVYQDGETTLTDINPSTVGALPGGYSALNNVGYAISTNATVSGPHIISFSVPSVTDQIAFNKLRILHAEVDPFDPEKLVWVDRTILSPDPQSPDFASKTIEAKVDGVGAFVIASYTQPSNTEAADLAIVITDSPDPVIVGVNLTLTVRVTNNGPDTATDVGLISGLAPNANFVSVSPSQGNCKYEDGTVYCKLGDLGNGASATVSVVIKPSDGESNFSTGEQLFTNTASAASMTADPNQENNSATESTRVLPDPNGPPTINITSPTAGTAYVGPTNITVTATANDNDGTISQVEFYGDGTLIGTGASIGGNQYSLTWNSVSFGAHTLMAIVTDNGGRKNISNTVNLLVNGSASVNITSPTTNSIHSPGSNVTIGANASHPSGNISKVEFFANGVLIGPGTLTNPNQYNVNWPAPENGRYSLKAVVTDGSGITTTSSPVDVIITSPPSVSLSSPVNGASFPSASTVAITASVQDDDGLINKIDFYANGNLLGTSPYLTSNQYTFNWSNVPDGIHSLTATAKDKYGVIGSSTPITIAVNHASPSPGEFVWFDDSIPQGASPHSEGGDDWYWVNANPVPILGSKSHQSKLAAGIHQHSFDGATDRLSINAGDRLFTYVFLDPTNLPKRIALVWYDGSWEHQAYWGEHSFGWGDGMIYDDGLPHPIYMGPLPTAAKWVRLEVPANSVSLGGKTVSGMAFKLEGGRATWDRAGKLTEQAPPLPPTTAPSDYVWVEDTIPQGATTSVVDDVWNWVSTSPSPYSGSAAHQAFFGSSGDPVRFRSHSFSGAQTPMAVKPGEVLFAYVYLDPTYTPDEIMLQWNDGNGWEHRAYWGSNFINLGVTGTESRRFMGGLPRAGQWVRLEVPASYVGLEGKSVSGMDFGVYRQNARPLATWDRAGKGTQLTATPLPLAPTTPFYRFYGTDNGGYYYYSTTDIGRADQGVQRIQAYIFANQAAGTVPLYRFRSTANRYFYTTSRNGPQPPTWQYETIAGYVYDNGSTPGTVPLYLFRDTKHEYFYTTTYSEGATMTDEGIACYVNDTNPMRLLAPSSLTVKSTEKSALLYWKDNSIDETGFKIERNGVIVATAPANTSKYAVPDDDSFFSCYRVQATNASGDSDYSNTACTYVWDYVMEGTPNSPPEVNIISPVSNAIVGSSFTVRVNAFDADGNGTISKVELFEGGNKLGEATTAPYLINLTAVAAGDHTLTVVATDTSGATVTSSPVTFRVYTFR